MDSEGFTARRTGCTELTDRSSSSLGAETEDGDDVCRFRSSEGGVYTNSFLAAADAEETVFLSEDRRGTGGAGEGERLRSNVGS